MTTLGPDERLPRRFGFWTGLSVVIASMVGSGILTTSGYTIAATESQVALLLVWAVGGVLALAGALTLAELATALPHVGGEYAFVRQAYGRPCAFVYGWSTQLLGFSGPVAIVSLISVEYLCAPFAQGFLPPDGGEWIKCVLATLAIAFFTLAHCLGHKESGRVQIATTLFKTASLAALAVAGLLWGKGSWEHLLVGKPMSQQSPAVLASALIYVMYGYTGWNGAVYLAGEIRDPARVLPRCLVAGCVGVAGLYLLINLAYAYALDPVEVAGMPDRELKPIAELATRRLFGPAPAGIVCVLIGVGMLATLSAFILTGARVAFAMANDGLFPRIAGQLHGGTGAPVIATMVQGLLSTALVWSGPFKSLLDYTSTGLAVIAGMVVSTIFPLRWQRATPRAFRTPWYPMPPLVFLLMTAGMVASSLYHEPKSAGLGVMSVLLGFPLYFLLARRTSSDNLGRIQSEEKQS